jgi:xanthine dehydrogenase YagS FAD-binding subunit
VRPFGYASARGVGEALGMLGGDGAARPLAGGTDLLTLMKADLVAPSRLVDVKRVPELAGGIEETDAGLTLGALTTLAEIEIHPAIRARYTALAEAAEVAATPQLRHMATIGGNLLQRPRCWYFRSEQFRCWLKGGDECYARAGENQLHALFDVSPCVAVHPSDPAPALVALGAEARLRGPAGERTVLLEELFAPPTDDRRTETTVRPDELIISLRVPRPADGTRGTYLKAMDRRIWAFALVGIAVVLRLERGRMVDPRIVLGGVAPIPRRLAAAERALAGEAPTVEAFARAAEASLADARPLARNGYKLPLARTLIERALAAVGGATGAS